MALYCFPSQFSHFFQRKTCNKQSSSNVQEKQNVVVLLRETSSTPSDSTISCATELDTWHQINSQYQSTLNEHGCYWWKTSGYALGALLRNAGYTEAAQLRSLEFFVRSVVPRIGIANKPGVERWKSFMTDDHNPIEFSWDWHTGHKAPQIRFSIEPVGLLAGTAQDPRNELMAAEFTRMMKKDVATTNLLWFNHFESYFGLGMQQHSPLGHRSSIFWAFDIGDNDIIGKAYFFPEYRAIATSKSNLQVMSEAIEAAPSSKVQDLSALAMFQSFAQEYLEATSHPLEMDMLAIDLVEPLKSRLKIYFRTRHTSFQSVRNAMTLGGRVTNSDMEIGLQNLRQLWDMLFEQRGVPDDVSLPNQNHRTAGLLFNIEFRLGSKEPKVKIYIPVRHYAQNDWQIMDAVSNYVKLAKWSSSPDTNSAQRPTTTTAYCAALTSVFGLDSLRRDKGRQTYVGCSVQASGLLRVVSYINPREVYRTDL